MFKSLKGYLLLHQLTTHNRIKYLCLHLEGPQSLVEWLGTRINQNEHKALGQTESGSHAGKGKYFPDRSSFFPCLLNEDLNSRSGVYGRHCQSPAHIPSTHTVPKYINHFLLQAPEKCTWRNLSSYRSLTQTYLDRQDTSARSLLPEQSSTNDQWELVLKNLCFQDFPGGPVAKTLCS